MRPIPAPPLHSQGSCPPPVGQFITLNGQAYRDRAGAVVKARKERQALVARLGVNDNQFYSSPKCSVLEDAGNDLYSNFDVREEYDPMTFSSNKDCLLYLASTNFTQNRVPMTILLIAVVSPGLPSECNVYKSNSAAFTIQFCKEGDTACLDSAEIEQSSNIWTVNVAPLVLAVLIALVLILSVVLGCCWWNGCFG